MAGPPKVKKTHWQQLAIFNTLHELSNSTDWNKAFPLFYLLQALETLLLLSILPFNFSHLASRNSWAHRSLSQGFFLALQLPSESDTVLLLLLAAYLIAKDALVLLSWRAVREDARGREQYLYCLRAANLLHLVDQKVLVLLLAKLLSTALYRLHALQIVLSLFIIAGLFAQEFVGQLFYYDYRFLKSNRYQTRHPWKSLRTSTFQAILASLSAFNNPFPRYLRVTLQTCLSCHRLSSHLIDYSYYMGQDSFYGYFDLSLQLVLAAECLISWLSLLLPHPEGHLDLDLVFIIALVSGAALALRLVRARGRRLVLGAVKPGERELLAEYLLHAVANQATEPRLQLELVSAMVAHRKGCADPRCYCFLADVYFEEDCGQNGVRDRVRRLNVFLERKDLESAQVLRLFRNPVVGEGKWEKFVGLQAVSGETREWLLANKTSRGEISSVVNFESEQLMKILIGSYLEGMPTDTADSFRLFGRLVAFHLFELENCLYCLVCLYQYMHSKEFRGTEQFQRTIILHNLFKMAKDATDRQHKEHQSDDGTQLDLSKVLTYHQTLDELRAENKQLIKDKKKFYEELSQPRIDLTKLLDLGSDVQDRITEASRKYDLLFDIHRRNLNILESFAYFEGFVLQKEHSSEKVRIALNEIVSMTEENMRRNFLRGADHYYDHGNAVLFTRQKKNVFEIKYFTSNTPELFEVSEERLRNGRLSDYIPSPVDEHHDKILSEYLHGVSRRDTSTFRTFLKTGSKLV